MKKISAKMFTPLLVLLTVTLLYSCSKSSPAPTPKAPTFQSSALLGTQWVTTKAVITKADGTVNTVTVANQLDGLYMSDVTFQTAPNGTTAGTANESDYGSLTWTYDSGSSKLSVFFDPQDGSVVGTIDTLTAHTMVWTRTTNPETDFNGEKDYAKVVQTFSR